MQKLISTIIILIITQLFNSGKSFSQELNVLSTYIVIGGSVDKRDVSELFEKGDAYLGIFKQEGKQGEYFRTNIPALDLTDDGKIINLNVTENDLHTVSISTFDWVHFANGSQTKSSVKLTLKRKGKDVFFDCTITLQNNRILFFTGYMLL